MATEKFLWRHIGPRPEDIENMLKVVVLVHLTS